MRIEAGKSYRTRDGRKATGITIETRKGCPVHGYVDGEEHWWRRDGHWHYINATHPLDLVSEWVDETADPVTTKALDKAQFGRVLHDRPAEPERAKVGDRVRFTAGLNDRIATVDGVAEHGVTCVGLGFSAGILHGDYTILEPATPSPSYTEKDVERLVAAAQAVVTKFGPHDDIDGLEDAIAPFLPQPKTCPHCGQKIEDQP